MQVGPDVWAAARALSGMPAAPFPVQPDDPCSHWFRSCGVVSFNGRVCLIRPGKAIIGPSRQPGYRPTRSMLAQLFIKRSGGRANVCFTPSGKAVKALVMYSSLFSLSLLSFDQQSGPCALCSQVVGHRLRSLKKHLNFGRSRAGWRGQISRLCPVDAQPVQKGAA